MADPSRRDLIAKAAYIAVRDVAEGVPIVGKLIQITSDTYEALAAERMQRFVENLQARVERLEELLKQREKVELFYRGLRLSVDARTADKIEALASAVAHGLNGDATDFEIAYMALEAIGSLDERQINLLRAIATSPPGSFQAGGFTVDQVGNRVPTLDRNLLDPILSVLQGKGLIARFQSPGVGFVGVDTSLYGITALGEAVNELLDSPIST